MKRNPRESEKENFTIMGKQNIKLNCLSRGYDWTCLKEILKNASFYIWWSKTIVHVFSIVARYTYQCLSWNMLIWHKLWSLKHIVYIVQYFAFTPWYLNPQIPLRVCSNYAMGMLTQETSIWGILEWTWDNQGGNVRPLYTHHSSPWPPTFLESMPWDEQAPEGHITIYKEGDRGDSSQIVSFFFSSKIFLISIKKNMWMLQLKLCAQTLTIFMYNDIQ